MEKNYKLVRNFISEEEKELIIKWVDGLEHNISDPNYHLSELSKSLNGKSCIFDISQTDFTKYISKFQSVSEVSTEKLPDFIHNIIDRVSKLLNLPKDHIFLQAVDMNRGGKINPHYDASIDGYISYKCNVSVLSEDYDIFIGDEKELIQQSDLYCFEASLYKHWTNEFNSRRIFLSFGFIIPYSTVNRDENDPRVRLSKRITKYFQNL
jgi:hypothetical protein